MKKIAVLIFGQYREFERAVKTWRFLDLPFEFDIYFSTWSSSYSIRFNSSEKIIDVTEKLISSRLKLKKCHIEDEELFIKNNDIMYNRPGAKLVHHMKLCINMLDPEIEYEHIIIIRPDLWLDTVIDFEKLLLNGQIEDRKVYTYGPICKDKRGVLFVADCLFVCNSATMKQFLNLPDIGCYNTHKMFAEMFLAGDITVDAFPGGGEIVIVRTNSLHLENPDNEEMKRLNLEWFKEWPTIHGKMS